MGAIILWLLLGALLGLGGAHTHRKVRNLGGWSAARALGATLVKSQVSRAIGVPLTRERTGRSTLSIYAVSARQVSGSSSGIHSDLQPSG